MIVLVALAFIDLFVTVFNILLIIRVISSYVVKPGNRFFAWIVGVTEPVLAPVRQLLPQTPGLDLAPLVTFFLLQGVQFAAHKLAGL
jgi:YggT family protein